VDDADRENEGDLVFAATFATQELVAFTMRECRGLLCVPMTGEDLDRLHLDQMVPVNTESHGTAFTVSVDARLGITTGISAADRAHTIRLLAAADAAPADFVKPGHVFPLRARPGGVRTRPGHTEAAVDLCRLAGLPPVAAICEIANDDGTMARELDLIAFAGKHNLAIVTIRELTEYEGRRR
jgi:3,4-dihydroxy 2-butanone 4-phosphate synthase/GTP cyclohydrolase II